MLVAAQQGADWAVGQLWRDLYPRLLAYFRASEPAAAEDLASDAWIDLARGLLGFRGDEPAFRRFAFTIARRRLLDHRRKAARRRTDPVRHEHLAGLPSSDDPTASSAAMDALAVIGRLPPDQAEVVLLRVVGGLSADEVAAIVGKKAGTVRVLQHRGLKRLAQILGDDP